jgi:hypothetical protein
MHVAMYCKRSKKKTTTEEERSAFLCLQFCASLPPEKSHQRVEYYVASQSVSQSVSQSLLCSADGRKNLATDHAAAGAGVY